VGGALIFLQAVLKQSNKTGLVIAKTIEKT